MLKKIPLLLFCLPFLLPADTPAKYQRKYPRTMIFSRGQYHYNPVLNYGGRWADRPLLVDPELNDPHPSGTTSIKALQAMGRNTAMYGLDGLASLYGKGTPALIRQLEKAQIPSFTLLPEIYATGTGIYDSPESLATMRKFTDAVFLSAAKSRITLKYKGKTVISSYNADDRPPEFWKALLDDYRRTEGDVFVFLPLLERPCGRAWYRWRDEYEAKNGNVTEEWTEKLKEHFRSYARVAGGLYLACAPVRSNADRHTDIAFFKYMIRIASEVMCEPEFKDKLFAIAARIGHENASRVGYIRGSYGTWCYRETMNAALAVNPDIIVIPEWDEQNENTSLRPTVYNMSSFMRLTRVFRGLSPELPHDDKTVPNLIISTRKVVVPGEKPEFELVSLPDPAGTVQVRFLLKAPDGRILHQSAPVTFSGKKMEDYRFALPTESWAGLTFVRPELEVTRNGRKTVYRDGLQYIKIEPVSNSDYQFVKQPLRDLINAPEVKFTVDAGNRFRVSFDAKEPIAYAELLDDNMPVYAATRDGKPYWKESADRKVFCIHLQNIGRFSHVLDGSFTVTGSDDVLWMEDTTFTWPSVMGKELRKNSLKFRKVQKLEANRFFFSIPAADAENAVLQIRVPGFFHQDLPLAQVLSVGVFGLPGKSIPVMSVSRQDFQTLQPVKLKCNSTAFATELTPQSRNSVIHLQVLTESGKFWRSAPVAMAKNGKKTGRIKVYSETTGQPAVLKMPETMIPVFDYRFDSSAGTALRAEAGRRYWGMAGGYAAQTSGRFGARRDSTVFITMSDFPKNAETASVDLKDGAWNLTRIGQHLALPVGVISRRTAFTVSIELMQTDSKGVQTILDNCASSPGLLKVWAENGRIATEITTDTLRTYRHQTGLQLPAGEWCTLKLYYGLDHLTLELNGKTFSAKCGCPGLYDTVTAVGGGKKGWFHGKIRRVTVDYREK